MYKKSDARAVLLLCLLNLLFFFFDVLVPFASLACVAGVEKGRGYRGRGREGGLGEATRATDFALVNG